jgi:peroxiredoxin
MSRTESKTIALGTQAPPFSLPDVVSGNKVSLDSFEAKDALLVMFICRHCPYVKHLQQELARMGHDYSDKSVGIVAISANDADAYPDDAPASLREMANELGFTFPYCYDESQDVARAYDAVCTPDFYVFDQKRRLVYHGQLDESRRHSDILVTGRDVRAAIDALLTGGIVLSEQKPSIGCSIKWK